MTFLSSYSNALVSFNPCEIQLKQSSAFGIWLQRSSNESKVSNLGAYSVCSVDYTNTEV
jgi:hypothetical protein